MQRISSFFSRIFAAFLALIMSLFPAKPAGDVLVRVPEITTATESFEVTVENNSADEIGYGLDAFTIEQRNALGWTTLKKSGDYAVVEIMRMLAPGASETLRVDLFLVYGRTLDAGEYRLSFQYYGKQEQATARVNFTVSPAA